MYKVNCYLNNFSCLNINAVIINAVIINAVQQEYSDLGDKTFTRQHVGPPSHLLHFYTFLHYDKRIKIEYVAVLKTI